MAQHRSQINPRADKAAGMPADLVAERGTGGHVQVEEEQDCENEFAEPLRLHPLRDGISPARSGESEDEAGPIADQGGGRVRRSHRTPGGLGSQS